MNIGDIIIIYLAFGAPLAVHHYLHAGGSNRWPRIRSSVLTLLFWIPTAVRLGRRYLSNAYPASTFVSPTNTDSEKIRITELQERVRTALSVVDRVALASYSLIEVLDRYVGLTVALDDEPVRKDDLSTDLFEAAGVSGSELAAVCLKRRNQRRIARHHKRARQDFLELFQTVSDQDPAAALTAVESGIALARQLGDKKAINGLEAIAARAGDEVWNLKGQPVLGNISLSMKRAPLNND